MSVHIDSSEVRALALDLANAPAEVRAKAPVAIKKTLFDIEADAKVFAPVDTGTLENSIGTDVDADGMGGEVGPTVDYGDEVEHGVGPHVIRAKIGGVLRFVVNGRVIFATSVDHPGSAPQPYMAPAFDRRAPGLEQALGDIGEGVL